MKLRFAPSPTGFLHVGGARTAIFNLLHARRYGGTMLLRIEDTDVERSRQHHAEQIVSSLQWLGVEWDEGPLYQSDRLDRYRERTEELVAAAKAYRCYCTRRRARRGAERGGAGRQAYRYSGPHAAGPAAKPDDAARHPLQGASRRPIRFHDLIRGDVHFEGELIDDFVLLRSDAIRPTTSRSSSTTSTWPSRTSRAATTTSPTLRSTSSFSGPSARRFRSFAHLPLILGGTRNALASALAPLSAEEYREMGIVPRGARSTSSRSSAGRPARPRDLHARRSHAMVRSLATSTKRQLSSIRKSCSG